MHEQTRRLDLHRHIGEHELDALERADGLAKRLPLARVVRRHVERGLGHAGRRRRDVDAPAVQAGERDLQSLALGAEPVRGGNLALIEDQLAGGEACRPILRSSLPMLKPGVPSSTTKAETPREPLPPVRAKTT